MNGASRFPTLSAAASFRGQMAVRYSPSPGGDAAMSVHHLYVRGPRRSRNSASPLFAALLLATLLVGPAFGQEERCIDGSDKADVASRLLTDKSELAHPAVEVSLPSSPHSVVVLAQPKDDVNTNYQGWVAVPVHTASCGYRVYELPPMTEPPAAFDIKVMSVFGATSQATKRYLVVLYRYHKNGSEQDSGYASYVYQWQENKFESQQKLSDQVAGLSSASAVRNRLRKAQN